MGQRLLGRRPRQAELEYWHTQEPISYFPGLSRPQTHTPPFPFLLTPQHASLLSKAQLWPQLYLQPNSPSQSPFPSVFKAQSSERRAACFQEIFLQVFSCFMQPAIQVFLSIILQILLPVMYRQGPSHSHDLVVYLSCLCLLTQDLTLFQGAPQRYQSVHSCQWS